MKHCGDCGFALEPVPEGGGHARARCPACGRRWYESPVPVTLVLVTTDEGNVVYTRKHSFEPWRWTVVAGFIEPGETAEAAALREVREETGLECEIVRFMGTHVDGDRSGQLVVAFHVRVTGGRPQAGDDVDEIDIAPPDPARLRPGATSQWLVRQYQLQRSALEPHPGSG